MKFTWSASALVVLAGLTTSSFTFAQDDGPAVRRAAPAKPAPSPDEAAIRANVKAYVAAFNARDAKAVAALWAPEAVYTNRTTGQQVAGREAIAKELAAGFEKNKDVRMEVAVDSLRFLSPGVVVEQGTAKVVRPKQPPEEIVYTAVHVKRDGKWLLDRVSEEENPAPPSHYEQLKELEWMIGDWVDDKEGATITTECRWAKNRNFITRAFKAEVGETVAASGMQIIGYDPAEKRIRSWVFDSDGGFAQGLWEHKGNRWLIEQVGTLPDGKRSSGVNIMTKLSDDAFTWQTVHREIGGRVEPNIDEILIVRKGTKGAGK